MREMLSHRLRNAWLKCDSRCPQMQVFQAERPDFSVCPLDDVIAVSAVWLSHLIKRLQVGLIGAHYNYPPLTDSSNPLR